MSKKEIRRNFVKFFKVIFLGFVSILFIKFFLFNENSQSYIKYNLNYSNNIKRAIIVDRSNDILVSNKNIYSLYISPSHTPDYNTWIKSISSILNINESELYDRLLNARTITLIYDDLTQQQAELIKKLQIRGVEIIEKEKRLYHHKTLASDIIGFLDKDNKGISGLEFYYENRIKYQSFDGTDERREFQITIEKNLQINTESFLEKMLSGTDAKGTCIFMGVDTGEILAMANYPRLRSENFSYDYKNIGNNAISDNFRAIPVVILSNFILFGKNHNLFQNNSVISNFNIQTNLNDDISFIGPINNDILKKITEQINFSSIYVNLGFGQKTGIDLPNESTGLIGDMFENSSNLSAFDIYATPLQILRAYSALINNGKLVTPFLNYREFSHARIKDIENEIIDLKKYSHLILDLMKQNNGYPLISLDNNPKISMDKKGDMIIIGHYPLDNPKVSYIIALSGSEIINVLKNDRIRRFLEMAQNASKIRLVSHEEVKESKSFKVVSKREPIQVMPDLTGFSMRKAVSMLQGSCNLAIKGSGVVVSQNPLPGTSINAKSDCEIKLN